VQINLGVATFIPKPHTPFQWEPQLSLEESKRRINRLKQLLPRQGFKIKWHDPEQSLLEGVFSRGDRRLSRLLETAWRNGARLDSWSEHFNLDQWRRAASACGIDLEDYLRRRKSPEESCPGNICTAAWIVLFWSEYARALQQEYTPDCRNHGCQGCGLCDFKTIKPVSPRRPKAGGPAPRRNRLPSETGPAKDGRRGISYRVHYTRLGDSRFFSHLEILQLIFAPFAGPGSCSHSQGFNPTPRVSFSQALPVGVESEVEFFDMESARRCFNTRKEAVAAL
jgi:hypothetical protein